MQEQVCKNCGNHFTGKFCNNCGEKVYNEHSKSFRHLFEEAFHFLTHLDSKFLKSVKLLLFRPGFLSVEFCRGVRKKYFKPISLFLIGVVLYLIFPLTQGLNMSFTSTVSHFRFNGMPVVERIAEKKMAGKNMSAEMVAAKYDSKSPKFAKILLFIILPLAGLSLQMLFYKRGKYYFDHFILGTELTTFFIYATFLIMSAFLKLSGIVYEYVSGKPYYYDDWVSGPIAILLLLAAWTSAIKRFYKVSTAHAFLKALLFLILFTIITFVIYRFILFLIVMLFI